MSASRNATLAADRVPPPPADRPIELPPLVEVKALAGWRLHWEDDPRHPSRRSTGRFRFDAPDGGYPVTYLNVDLLAAFGEVYGDTGEIAPNQGQRRLARIRARAPLHLVDLRDAEAMAAYGLDLRISALADYGRTMRWGAALRRWHPKADGIRYLGRHAGLHSNYCLFLDRCGDKLEVRCAGRLSELRPIVLRAAEAYSLAPRLFEPEDPGGTP